MNRLKILAVAYACDPTRGSEFGVGWGWVDAIAAKHDVTVITADFNAGDIEQYLRAREPLTGPCPRFVYIKNRPWHYRPQGIWLKIEGSAAKPLMNIVYQNWLGYAFAEAKREVAGKPFRSCSPHHICRLALSGKLLSTWHSFRVGSNWRA